MKIAIIQPRVSYYTGGGEIVSLRHAEYLSKIEGNQIDLFTTNPFNGNYSKTFVVLKEKRNKDLMIIEKDIPSESRYIYNIEPGIDQSRWSNESVLFNLLIKDDIINGGHDIILSYYIGDTIFEDLNIPNVVYLGGYPRKRNPEYIDLLKNCDATISNSENVKSLWVQDFSDSGISLNYVLSKGADTYEDGDTKRNDKSIVFAGRLIERKGVKILINAFKKAASDIPDIKLIILGDGPQMEELKMIVSRLNLEDRVTFVGVVDNVQKYFSNATLCVFPSLEGEGLMTVVAEAMMAGSCIITSKGQGSEEIIEDGKTGVLINSDNVEELYKSILDLVLNSEKRKFMGENAEKFAKSNLSWEKAAQQLDRFLRNVIEKSKNKLNVH